MTSPGAPDGLSRGLHDNVGRLAGADGVVIGLAIDHRDNFRAVLARAGRTEPDLPGLKERIVRALVPDATALMLDHELGSAALQNGAVPSDVGLIMPLEEQGYEQMGDDRTTSLMSDFTPSAAAGLGAIACKVLLPYRPDRRATADRQLELAATAIATSHVAGLPLILEPTVYRLEDETDDTWARNYTDLVIRSTAETAELGPDLLKLPHPSLYRGDGIDTDTDRDACRQLDVATAGIPWVLLGAGVPAAVFARQIESVGAAGASGFLAGRSIWSGAVVAAQAERPAAIASARSRLREFAEIARGSCASLHRRIEAAGAARR